MRIFALNNDINEEILLAAAERSESSYLKLKSLIDQGGNPNMVNEHGESVLHLSCIFNNPAKVQLLLEAGADPNYSSNLKESSLDMTPLSWCVYGQHYDSVKLLINDRRTNINYVSKSEDKKSITPLDIAYKIQNSYMVKLLLQNGAKIFDELDSQLERKFAMKRKDTL